MEIEIDKEQLIEFNKTLTGAAHRVIKPHQLDSVFSSYFYYEDIPSQIASIVNSIIKNHPFGDGNKRTAMMTLYYLTQTYDVIIELEGEKEIFEAIQYVVNNKLEIEEVVEVLQLKEKGNDKNRS
jgi:death-on-curing family protein